MRHLLLATLACSLAGCLTYSYNVRPGTAPHCTDGVCFEVVSFGRSRSSVGAWLDAPAGAVLRNARFAFDKDPPCISGIPVAWVRVGKTLFRQGPADVAGQNGLVFGFPDKVWWAHDEKWTESFVDVDLEVPGGRRCIRAGLVRADDVPLVGR
jgi:hypothetical protein